MCSFDTIDHGILLKLLEKRIDDHKFVGLIKGMLEAGYMDDWAFERTYSGTPQGGIVSPLLANIYLHELDMFMAEMRAGFDQVDGAVSPPRYARSSRCFRSASLALASSTRCPCASA